MQLLVLHTKNKVVALCGCWHIRQWLVTSLVCYHWARHSFYCARLANLWKDYFDWIRLKATSILAPGSFLSPPCCCMICSNTQTTSQTQTAKNMDPIHAKEEDDWKWNRWYKQHKTLKQNGSEISPHVHFNRKKSKLLLSFLLYHLKHFVPKITAIYVCPLFTRRCSQSFSLRNIGQQSGKTKACMRKAVLCQ